MLNCWVCPFNLDCKVETETKKVTARSFDRFSPGTSSREIRTPKNEADCPLKRAVEVVNRQIDRINSLGIEPK